MPLLKREPGDHPHPVISICLGELLHFLEDALPVDAGIFEQNPSYKTREFIFVLSTRKSSIAEASVGGLCEQAIGI